MPPRHGTPSVAACSALAVLLATALPAFAHDDVAPHREALATATARAPGDLTLWLTRADLARIAGDLPAAEAALEQAGTLAPSSPAVARLRGAVAFERGDVPAARTIVETALAVADLDADDEAGLAFLAARIAEAQDRLDDAIEAHDRGLAATRRPTAEAYLARAALARAVEGPESSARGLAIARARLPFDGALLDALARDLTALGRGDEAAAMLAAWDPTSEPDDPHVPWTTAAAPAPSPGRTHAPTLVPRNARWRWSTPGVEPAGWETPAPNDTTWPAGPAPLGFGDPFIATTIPMGATPSVRYTTSYMRIVFDVAIPPATITALSLAAFYDDGFVAYLNGVEIARRGFPAGPVGFSTFATNHEATAFETINVNAALPLLVLGANVLAVEVHQATSTSSDLAWNGELVASTGAPSLVRGPYLQNGGADAITVRWRTDIATDSRVWIGTSPGGLAPAATDPVVTTEHEVRVTGLSPENDYHYAVGSTTGILAGDDANHAFRTAPAPGDARPTRIWVLGDSGLPGAPQNRVRDAYAAFTGAIRTDVWLMLGDNAYQTGTDAEFGAGVFAPYASWLRRNVLWPTRGNHDFVHAGAANDYYDLFTMPMGGEAGGAPSSSEAWYSFDHGDIHFVCLDSEGSNRTPGSPMLTWLAGDLASNPRSWTIVFFHHPPYTKGSHDSDEPGDSGGRMRDMRENVMPLLEAAGVDLVLAGHSHSYERSFLLDGHHGLSGTLTPAMILDAGDGDPAGDGAYVKATAGSAPNEGEVVAVAGSSAQVSGGPLNHPAMMRSLNVLGSLVIDVDGGLLEAKFLDDLGAVRDRFVIEKGAVVGAPAGSDRPLSLRVEGANPFRGATRLGFDLPRPGSAEIRLVDAAGRRVRRIAAGTLPAGPHSLAWDGNDESGRRTPAGLYFAVLDVAGERRVARLLRLD